MSTTLTLDIASILAFSGFGTIGEDIFVSLDVPPKPDDAINIRNLGTFAPDYPSMDLAMPTVQIIVRASKGSSQACETRIYAIKDFMKTIANYYMNDSRYVYINHQSGPVDIGVDYTMRPMYSLNMSCMRTTVNI